MTEKIRCGGHYCEVCKKCISVPRLRKNYQPDWWTVCQECEYDVISITFLPGEDCLWTDFKVKHKDIPSLIQLLIKSYEGFTSHKTQETSSLKSLELSET